MDKKRLAWIGLFALLALLTACGGSKGYRSISPQELQALDPADVFLIDTNPTDEGRIPNTDAHIPFDAVAEHTSELPDKGTTVAVYCSGGGRSSQAAKALVELGYTDVLHLDGGLDAWRKAGYTVE